MGQGSEANPAVNMPLDRVLNIAQNAAPHNRVVRFGPENLPFSVDEQTQAQARTHLEHTIAELTMKIILIKFIQSFLNWSKQSLE